MLNWIRNYFVPLLLALSLHVLVGFALWAGWNPDTERPLLVKPKLVKAKLIQMQPPQSKPEQKPPPKVAPAPKLSPKIEKEQKVQPKLIEERPESQLEKEREAKRLADEERTRRLNELVTSSFDLALNDESEAIDENENEALARTYAQGIYELIVANWSRPPSARNGMQATLQVELVPTGDIALVTVIESSGNTAFDRSAEMAVKKAGKFEVPRESRIFEENFRRFPVIFKPEDLLR